MPKMAKMMFGGFLTLFGLTAVLVVSAFDLGWIAMTTSLIVTGVGLIGVL